MSYVHNVKNIFQTHIEVLDVYLEIFSEIPKTFYGIRILYFKKYDIDYNMYVICSR